VGSDTLTQDLGHVENAIVHGEWHGVKELHLLVHGVPDERGKELRESDAMFKFIT
jgi:hypothetical protein